MAGLAKLTIWLIGYKLFASKALEGAELILSERTITEMMARAGTAVCLKGVPPFFGRQIRQRSRGVERLFAFTPSGSQLRMNQCPQRFQRVSRKVFQGIQVAKGHSATTAASLFNEALGSGNSAILKFISLGLQAVSCSAIGDQLVLELQALGRDRRFIILCDEPSAFVAR